MSASILADLHRRNRRFGIYTLLLAATAGALIAPNGFGQSATFRLNEIGVSTFAQLPDLVLPVGPTALLLGMVIAFVGGVQLTRGFGNRAVVVVGVVTALFVLAFLTWAAGDRTLSLVGLLKGSVTAAVPLGFGAMSGILCERAGVINIAIEGQFLTSAFTAAIVASATGSAWAGLAAGIAAGATVGAILALLTIRYRADQIVAGVVLIVLATGLTSFLNAQVLAPNPHLNAPARLPVMPVPVLSEIPFLGPLLFRQTILVYAMIGGIAILHWGLFHTRWGLRHRAVGEHPRAADTVGIRVLATRYRAVILGGAAAGLGGAYMTLDAVSQFSRDMSAGRGFIALAAVLVGRYNPWGALGAALVFGFAQSLSFSLQLLQVGVSSTLLLTVPYVATILIVAGLVGRLRVPAADGKPYTKE